MRAHGALEARLPDGSREESITSGRPRGVWRGRSRPPTRRRWGRGGCRGLAGRRFARSGPRLRRMDLWLLRLAWWRNGSSRLGSVGPPGRSERARRGMPDRPGPGGLGRAPGAPRRGRGGGRRRAECHGDPEQGSHARPEAPRKESPEQGPAGGFPDAILCPPAPIARHAFSLSQAFDPPAFDNLRLRVVTCVCLQVSQRQCQVNGATTTRRGG